MTTEIKELSRAYQLWLIIKDNPGIKMPDVAKAMGSHTKNISDAITKMVKSGNISTQGKKGIRTYTANKSSPPVMYGRGSYKLGKEPAKPSIFLEPTPGNSVFEECRANWQGYQLNQYLREVRA